MGDAEGGRDYDYDNNMRRRPAKFQQKFLGEIGAAAVYLITRAASAAGPAWEKFGGAAVESPIRNQMQRWDPCTSIDKPRETW